MAIPPFASYPMPTEQSLPANQVSWRADAARAVLLLHDMQSYFLQPYAWDDSPCAELIANAKRLRARATALGIPVVYSAQTGGMDRAQRGLLHDFWGPGMSTRDSDVKIVDELCPAEGDVVVTKWRYSAFARSGLGDLIRGAGRDQLIVCGVYAHVGCLITAVDAFSMDIQPFFVADAVADFSADYHRLALDYAALRCASVVSTAQLLEMLAASPTAADRGGEADCEISKHKIAAQGYRPAGSAGNVPGVADEFVRHDTETFRVSADITIEAEPAEVFAFVSDLTNSGEWSPECKGGTWLTGGPSLVGSVFEGHNYRAPDVVAWAPVVRGEWTTRSEVVEVRAPHVFRWAMRDSAGQAQQSIWSFELRPAPEGCVLTHAFWMGELTEGMRGILSRMAADDRSRFIAEWSEKIEGDMYATLRRIKSAMESVGPVQGGSQWASAAGR